MHFEGGCFAAAGHSAHTTVPHEDFLPESGAHRPFLSARDAPSVDLVGGAVAERFPDNRVTRFDKVSLLPGQGVLTAFGAVLDVDIVWGIDDHGSRSAVSLFNDPLRF